MEGYSKLAVEIGDLSGNRVNPDELLECIKSLIGMYEVPSLLKTEADVCSLRTVQAKSVVSKIKTIIPSYTW